MKQLNKDIDKYSKEYSDEGLWAKLLRYGRKAGLNTVYYVLLLYFVYKSDTVPLRHKAMILGALGYFITPLDFIPDLMAGGYVDDVSVLLFALNTIKDSITYDVKQQAKRQLHQWFEFDDSDLSKYV